MESKMEVVLWMRAGTSRRGLAAMKAGEGSPVPTGVCEVKGRDLVRRAMRTFWA